MFYSVFKSNIASSNTYLDMLHIMLKNIASHGPTLVDQTMTPRYWSAVWSLFHGSDLAPSTLKQKLGHIEALYQHTENIGGSLDDDLSELNFDRLGNALEAFFVMLRNVPKPSATALVRWNTAFHFIRDTCNRLERDPSVGNKMAGIQERISRLDNLYLGLRPYKRRYGTKPRAIPRSVVAELLDAVLPGSQNNPFKAERTQWRVYILVSLMLLQGLRRGEVLSLPADFLKSERDHRTGNIRWRLSVSTNDAENDPRALIPSIKTAQSIRIIPVTTSTANDLQAYAENYRGKVDHGFYVSSVRNQPMSLEGVNKSLCVLTSALSPQARAELFELTGARIIRPHALRHTCAVVRMKQLLAAGNTPEQAMMHLRSFFGWSKTSMMPLHYAKAALDERLNETWNEHLDDRVALLRGLPE